MKKSTANQRKPDIKVSGFVYVWEDTESGLTESAALMSTSAIWGQHPAVLPSESPLGAGSGQLQG